MAAVPPRIAAMIGACELGGRLLEELIERYGAEGVAAAVVLKADAAVDQATLAALVKDRLRSSRVPQRWQFAEALPYNETGKLLRRVIREQFVHVHA